MKTNMELYDEHLKRINDSVALEKTDRTAVILMADAFCAKHMSVNLSEFYMDPVLANKTILKSFKELGDIDSLEKPYNYAPSLGPAFFSKVRIPGRELPENTPAQVDEIGSFTVEDYDTVIDKGWNYFANDFYKNRLDNGFEVLSYDASFMPEATQKTIESGMVLFCPTPAMVPFDAFSAGRSISKFSKDLFRMPDKIQAAIEAAMPDTMDTLRMMIRMQKPVAVFMGGARAASSFVSRKVSEKYFFPYLKQMAQLIVEEGPICYFHFDSEWTRDIDIFLDMPKKKCVFGTDGATDIYKLKEILGNHMCIMGDVGSSMLALCTPDEVYNYSSKLIRDIGPTGYILSQSCSVPYNAKVENVKAMVAAAAGK